MKTTIDKAGRVVIPIELRRRAGLEPGTALEIIEEGFSIRLVPDVPEPRLVRRHGRLVAEPAVPEEERSAVDVAALVEEERERWPR